MEAVIFIGLQAAGKSSFYKEKFIDTHIRINLDMLKTRHREHILFKACLEAKQPLVIDNTNPTLEDRSRYIIPAKESKFKIIGYNFDSQLEQCKKRNNLRKNKVPMVGMIDTYKKLQLPRYQEGFDLLYHVTIRRKSFVVEEWYAV